MMPSEPTPGTPLPSEMMLSTEVDLTINVPEEQIHSPEAGEKPSEYKGGVMAIDPATFATAFNRFSEFSGVPLEEIKPSSDGERLLGYLSDYTDTDRNIHDIVADVGDESRRRELNKLAEQHGFDSPFGIPFADGKVGVLSIVDKKLKWYPGDTEKAKVSVESGENFRTVEGVRFRLTEENDDHFAIFDVKGFDKPLIRIAANPDESNGVQNYMWVTQLSEGSDPLLVELFEGVKDTISAVTHVDDSGITVKRRGAAEVATVTIPKLEDVTYSRDWDELVGTELGEWSITEAAQMIRVSVDEVGAEATAMTRMGLVMRGGPVDSREDIVIGDTGPMVVFFTEGDSKLPICANITNQDAWRTPA